MSEIIITTKTELTETIRKIMDERDATIKENENPKSLTINQVAMRLGRAHATIKKMVTRGYFTLTKDGRIREKELDRFLAGK
ncbi:MAG TPA: hypothetical protein PLH40_07515 [Bacteroidales bacterium]|nr:hypothetical protein [Bacteroidales bacterium]